MTNKEFNQKAKEMLANVESRKLETMIEDKMKCKNVFNYAAWCEVNFERNLREGYKRKTTFTSDISIAEWCESMYSGRTSQYCVGTFGTKREARERLNRQYTTVSRTFSIVEE